jgi:hypothetical protein
LTPATEQHRYRKHPESAAQAASDDHAGLVEAEQTGYGCSVGWSAARHRRQTHPHRRGCTANTVSGWTLHWRSRRSSATLPPAPLADRCPKGDAPPGANTRCAAHGAAAVEGLRRKKFTQLGCGECYEPCELFVAPRQRTGRVLFDQPAESAGPRLGAGFQGAARVARGRSRSAGLSVGAGSRSERER